MLPANEEMSAVDPRLPIATEVVLLVRLVPAGIDTVPTGSPSTKSSAFVALRTKAR
jgi:hypothetical protein